MANLVPRAPRNSRVSPCLSPMWLSSPASRAVWTRSASGSSVGRVAPDAEVAGDRAELAVQVLPFAHPQVVEELGPAQLAELVGGQLGLAFVQVAPEVEPGQEVGALVGEAAVELVGPLLLVGRALARVLDGQGGHDHQHLAGAAEPARLQQHPGQPRVGRDLGQLAAHLGQAAAVKGAQLAEEIQAVLDAAPVGRVDEREPGDVAQPQRGHLEDHRGQVGAQDLRLGELGPAGEVVLGVQPDADAVGGAPAAALALVGRRLRDGLDRQALHLGPVAVAGDPGRARVDHVLDAGHGQRGLGHVGGQHHPPPGVGLEHAVLLAGGQPRVQRQHLHPARAAGEVVAAQGLGGVADLPLPAEEHQDVPGALAAQLVDRVQDPLGLVAVVVGVLPERPVADLDRVGAARHLDHRGAAEMPAEPLRVDGGRGDDQLEIGPVGQQPGQVAEQEVDVEAALVGLVENDRVVAAQRPVPFQLGQQDPVGHQLDLRVPADPVGEPDLVPHRPPQLGPELGRHPLGHCPGGQPPRLGVPDHPGNPPPQLQADLRQLGRFPRPGLPRHHHNLMVPDRLGDLPPPLTDRQLRRIGDGGRSHTTQDREPAGRGLCPKHHSRSRGTVPARLAARRHGQVPSISTSSEKLSKVLMRTISPSTATFSNDGSTATVRMMSAATRNSSASRMLRPNTVRTARYALAPPSPPIWRRAAWTSATASPTTIVTIPRASTPLATCSIVRDKLIRPPPSMAGA